MHSIIRTIALLGLMVLSLAVSAAEKSPRDFQQILASGELRVGVAIFPRLGSEFTPTLLCARSSACSSLSWRLGLRR